MATEPGGRSNGRDENPAEHRSIYVKEFTAEVDGGKITGYRISAKVTFDLGREPK